MCTEWLRVAKVQNRSTYQQRFPGINKPSSNLQTVEVHTAGKVRCVEFRNVKSGLFTAVNKC